MSFSNWSPLKSWSKPWSNQASGLFKQFDHLMNDFGQLMDGLSVSHSPILSGFNVDIREEDSTIILEADIPGLKKEDIDVSIENGVLSISCQRNKETDNKKDGYHLRERFCGKSVRQFSVPSNVDEKSIVASYVDGVLKITLQKTKETRSRKVDIKG